MCTNLVAEYAAKAKYADLAELFVADNDIEVGTVVEFIDYRKVGVSNTESSICVGVVSTRPGFVLGEEEEFFKDKKTVQIALAGTVQVKVIGNIKINDRLVSAGNGCARAMLKDEQYLPGIIIGIAQENNEEKNNIIYMLVRNL
jgi:hypothetical protein